MCSLEPVCYSYSGKISSNIFLYIYTDVKAVSVQQYVQTQIICNFEETHDCDLHRVHFLFCSFIKKQLRVESWNPSGFGISAVWETCVYWH